MKAVTFVVLLAVCAIECRKIVPINKNANIDFINMESGGVGPAGPPRPAAPAPAPSKPLTPEAPKTPTFTQPKTPVPAVTTAKPVLVPVPTVPPPTQIKPIIPQPAKPLPNQMDLKPLPVKPAAAGGVTTPGYGNVKQLVTFYDSQGKASVIRPYSYADAVKKQG